MKSHKRVAILDHQEDPSEAEPEHSPSLLTTRVRRKSVEAGSLLSARKSLEREEERNYAKAQGSRKAMDFARGSVASHLVTIGSMFVLWDDGHQGYLHRNGFVQAMAALGTDKKAADEIFDELDDYGTGKIHYGAYLECALRDGLSQASARLVQLCREIDLESTKSGLVGRDEFRLAVQRLGWEMPPLCTDARSPALNQSPVRKGMRVMFFTHFLPEPAHSRLPCECSPNRRDLLRNG